MVLQLICSVQISIVSPAENGQILSYRAEGTAKGILDQSSRPRDAFVRWLKPQGKV